MEQLRAASRKPRVPSNNGRCLANRLLRRIRRETASQNLSEDSMKKVQSLWFLSALALFLSVGISLSAQQTTPQTSTPDAQSQPSTAPDTQSQPTATPEQAQPSTPEQAQPSQTPDDAKKPAPESQMPNAQTQSFSGTI